MPVFSDPPVLCGHRGSGRGHAENTLPSFRAAVAAGLPWVEVDARIAGDGFLVARHDPELDDGRLVAAVPAAETGLMRITELLHDLPPSVGLNVEIKSSLEDALRLREYTTAALVADLLEQCHRPLLVTSFDPAALLIVRERAEGLPLGLLTWTRFPLHMSVAAASHLGMQVIVANVESFDGDAESAVSMAHRVGLEVAAWCPREEERERLVGLGVDCLIVDPAPAVEPEPPPA